jgi:hypothetical protein
MLRKAARYGLLSVVAMSGLAIALRMLFGPFDAPVRVRTPLNPEGWLGLALTILLATTGGGTKRIGGWERHRVCDLVLRTRAVLSGNGFVFDGHDAGRPILAHTLEVQLPSTDFLDAPPFPLKAGNERATPTRLADLYASAISCRVGSFCGDWAKEGATSIAAIPTKLKTEIEDFTTPSLYVTPESAYSVGAATPSVSSSFRRDPSERKTGFQGKRKTPTPVHQCGRRTQSRQQRCAGECAT